MTRPPARSTLFPYTTLFRSDVEHLGLPEHSLDAILLIKVYHDLYWVATNLDEEDRSEEHTSELQSHVNLVCRLLLEKKKYKVHNTLANALLYHSISYVSATI